MKTENRVTNSNFNELCAKILALEKENQSLKIDNDFLQRQNKALKLRCSKYCRDAIKLETELQDLKITKGYLTSEDAGRKFAQELLGVGQ